MKGFSNSSNNLWVYPKGVLEIRPSSAKNEGFQKYYYSFNDTFGNKHTNTVEDYFSKIEGNFGEVLNKIHAKYELLKADKENLAVFMAFIQTRVPWFRTEIDRMANEHIQSVGMEKAKEDFESSLTTFIKEFGVQPQIQHADFIENNEKRGSNFSLMQAFDVSSHLSKQLLGMKWRFLFSNDNVKFITSDNPIYYYSNDGQDTLQEGPFRENIEFTIPLSKQVALLAKKTKLNEGYSDANQQAIRTINKRTVYGALVNVYASFQDTTFMKFIHKNKDVKPYMILTKRNSD